MTQLPTKDDELLGLPVVEVEPLLESAPFWFANLSRYNLSWTMTPFDKSTPGDAVVAVRGDGKTLTAAQARECGLTSISASDKPLEF